MKTLIASEWRDYRLLDSGGGRKLERFGPYTLIRPEAQATWRPALPEEAWEAVHASFEFDASGNGRWRFHRPMERRWKLAYGNLRFWVEIAQSRHLGVFPENAIHWDWIQRQLRDADPPLHVLNLFGYTGLATLAAAEAGARVTHVDASRRAVAWARENQALSGLADRPVRWIVEDALTYVQREERRGVRYDGIVMDPPAFGRGPKGQVWTFEQLFPMLCQKCRAVLSKTPRFVVMTVYTSSATAALVRHTMKEMMAGYGGRVVVDRLATPERPGSSKYDRQGQQTGTAASGAHRNASSEQSSAVAMYRYVGLADREPRLIFNALSGRWQVT